MAGGQGILFHYTGIIPQGQITSDLFYFHMHPSSSDTPWISTSQLTKYSDFLRDFTKYSDFQYLNIYINTYISKTYPNGTPIALSLMNECQIVTTV